MSASSSAESGVFSEGFSTIRLLVAIDGATLCATWFSGWLNGVIARDHAQQRLAQRVHACAILPCGVRSQEKIWPSSLQRRVGGEDEHVADAADLVERVLLAQARLGGDEVGDLVGAARGCSAAALCRIAVALVARELRPVGRGRSRTRGARPRRVALGTVPTSVAGVRDCGPRSTRSPPTCSPAMRIFAAARGRAHVVSSAIVFMRRLEVVQREVEGVEIAPAARRQLAGAAGWRSAARAARTMPPCERSGASSPDRSWRVAARADARSGARETTTRSPTRSGGSSKRAARLVARRARPRCRAARRCARRGVVDAPRRQVDGRERAERAVVDDVRIGDRQDHARRCPRRTSASSTSCR